MKYMRPSQEGMGRSLSPYLDPFDSENDEDYDPDLGFARTDTRSYTEGMQTLGGKSRESMIQQAIERKRNK